MFGVRDGELRHAGDYISWMPEVIRPAQGDEIGLLLDLEAGTLAVYHEGRRLGLMVRGGLTGPLRWAVDLWDGAALLIQRGDAPPVTATDREEDARKHAEALALASDEFDSEDEADFGEWGAQAHPPPAGR